ncbi:MAG: extracellular solute-binding protein [Anaerolineae bacterium]|nr:extracellular solute-binding protein [Anaerolineae bacterium]
MKTNRPIILLGILMIALLLLAACGAQPAAPAPAEAPAEQADTGGDAASSESTGPVTLRFLALADDSQLNAWKEMLVEFKKIDDGKWSHVDLEFETVPFRELFPKIEASVAAGLAWDLFQADGPDMKHYGFNRVVVPLGDHFSEEELKQWFPQSIEEGSFRGELLGPPMMQSCSLMMYNKDMTDAAGITPPANLEDAWTMSEAMDAWKKTTVDEDGDGIPDQWGVRWGQGTWSGDYEHGILRRSNGEKGSDAYKGMGDDGVTFTGYLDSPESIEAMQFYQDMHLKDKVTPVEAIPDIFESRKAAFMVTPDNRIGRLNFLHGEGNFNWGVTGIPYFKTPVCHTGSWHYGISPNSEHFEEALAFVRYASSDDGARIWYKHVRQLPANVGLFNELPEYAEDGNQRMWLDAMNSFGIPRIQTPGYTEYQQMFAEAATNIAAGADPAEQLGAAAGRVEGLLAKYTGWNQ